MTEAFTRILRVEAATNLESGIKGNNKLLSFKNAHAEQQVQSLKGTLKPLIIMSLGLS